MILPFSTAPVRMLVPPRSIPIFIVVRVLELKSCNVRVVVGEKRVDVFLWNECVSDLDAWCDEDKVDFLAFVGR